MLTWLLANKKLLGAVTGGIAALVAVYQLHGYVYESGYRAAINSVTLEHNKALEKQRKDYEKQIDESLVRINQDHAQELERVRNEREIITKVKTVTEYVDKEIIVTPECDGLSSDIVRVFSQATSIISDSTKDR